MAKHYQEFDGTIHSEGSDGIDYTLCGNALEGVDGDQEMTETRKRIDCERCVGIIRFSKRVKARELKSPPRAKGGE